MGILPFPGPLRTMLRRRPDGPGKRIMRSRRAFLAVGLALLPVAGYGQPAKGFVGQWQGTVEGIGEAKIVITAVKPDGLVEGRMEFVLRSHVSTFADKADLVRSTNRGVVSGATLTIDAALGGTYRLTLAGDSLAGTYSRGTSFSGPATFKRV